MEVFELRTDSDAFLPLEIAHADDIDLFIDGFDGRPMKPSWTPPEVRLAPAERRRGLPTADFAALSGAVPAIGERAVELLGDTLERSGELLPLRCDGPAYWALNVLSVVDLLDERRSDVDWLAPGRMVVLRSFVRRESTPDPNPVFKLRQWRKGHILITRDFVDAVVRHGLTGLEPRRVGTL